MVFVFDLIGSLQHNLVLHMHSTIWCFQVVLLYTITDFWIQNHLLSASGSQKPTQASSHSQVSQEVSVFVCWLLFFLQFWWLIQCWYSACIFISLLSICIPLQSRKPVTSGDIASQPRPWYIYDSQPQPSCPAVLSTILSLSAGSQDSLLDFGLPLTDKTARLLIACKTRSTADHTPTQTRAHTHTPARSLLTQAHDSPHHHHHQSKKERL